MGVFAFKQGQHFADGPFIHRLGISRCQREQDVDRIVIGIAKIHRLRQRYQRETALNHAIFRSGMGHGDTGSENVPSADIFGFSDDGIVIAGLHRARRAPAGPRQGERLHANSRRAPAVESNPVRIIVGVRAMM